jgi:Ser/Thr protein kinase RdoA (MazF antagonist)
MTTAQVDVVLADVPELQTCLHEAFAGRTVRLGGQEQLKANVHRLHVEVDGAERSVVVKRSDPVVARRNWHVARRWLPAVGLEALGPPLLTIAAERNGERTWHVYEDLPGRSLSADRPVKGEVELAIDAIAHVHTSFAGHPLLRECRLWGGDRSIHFYSGNLRDADIALRSLDLARHSEGAIALRDALLERLRELSDGAPYAASGPETLLHGDLWPTNMMVTNQRVRLIDWDQAAVGPIWFDVSTFLLRFPPEHRAWILDGYRQAVSRLAGWRLPSADELNPILATAGYARLASLLVWSIAAAADEPGWLLERLTEMCGWLDEVEPVIPSP